MESVALIDTFSRGLHKEAMEKRAACFDDIMDGFKRKPGHAYLHLISTGALEKYGVNSNGDAFPKEAYECRPFLGGPVMKMGGGLKEYHDKTFMQHGKVYKNHENGLKNGKASGYIVKAAYNTIMDRGELLVGVDEQIWRHDLEKLAEGKPVFVSMGCVVETDCCSACHNRAHKKADYCQHVRNDLLALTKEGHQVCLINDKPIFHDISGVFKPADKIAFALRKVAAGGVVTSAELAELHGFAPRLDMIRKFAGAGVSRRAGLLAKLAKIEKEILASTADGPERTLVLPFTACDGAPEELDDHATGTLAAADPGAVFGSLKRKMVMMPLETFLKVVTGDGFGDIAGLVPKAKELLPGVFGRLEDSPCGLEDGSYEPTGQSAGRDVEEEIGRLVGSHSLAAGPVSCRVIKITIAGGGGSAKEMPKEASAVKDAAADFLAGEYARYALSFADGLPEERLGLVVGQVLANGLG